MHTAHLSERLTEFEATMLNEVRRAYHARLVEIENHPQGCTTYGDERRRGQTIVRALTKMLTPYGYVEMPSPFALSMQSVLGTGEGKAA